MKKLLLILCLAGLASSCVDKAYDLSKVETDDVTIGGDGSEFKMPLAQITISMNQVGSADIDIEAIFKEVDIWLPSPLPAGATSVDLTQLVAGTQYTETILNALIDQMERDEQKLDEVTDLIWREYKELFLPLLPIQNPDEATFKEAFKLAFVISDGIQNASRDIAQSYLIDLRIDPLDYQIGSIDIGSEVVDMLADNLDPQDTPNPKNTLHLYGKIVSELPVGIHLMPSFVNTLIEFGVTIEPDKQSAIPETQLFAEDLRAIINDANIRIPLTLLSYFPAKKFANTQKISIQLSLAKRGGLTINL